MSNICQICRNLSFWRLSDLVGTGVERFGRPFLRKYLGHRYHRERLSDRPFQLFGAGSLASVNIC